MSLHIRFGGDAFKRMTPLGLQPLLEQIKTARERKGLTQRALGLRVGLPQSHISKIEKGMVDLQAGSLIQIARALDLEVVLLPCTTLTAARGAADAPAPNQPIYGLDDNEKGDG